MNHRSDIYPVSIIVVLFALKLWAILSWTQPLVLLCLVPANALLTLIAISAKHNHVHVPVFRTTVANRVYEFFLNFVSASTTSTIQIVHVLNHHNEVNGPLDWARTSTRSQGQARREFIAYSLFTPWVFIKQLTKWKGENEDHFLVKLGRFENFVMLSIYLCLAIYNPIAFLLVLFLPGVLSQFGLAAFNFLQHYHCDPDSLYNHSRNMTGFWFNACTFNAGYHTAHHEEAVLHWTLLPALHNKLSSQIDPELTCPSMLVMLGNLIFRNKLS